VTWVIMLVSLAAAALCQMWLPAPAWLGQAKFPALMAVVLYYALNHGTGVMFGCAFLAGMLQDALSPIPLGYSGICFALAGWIASRFRRTVLLDAAVTPLVFGAACGSGAALALYVMLARQGLVAWPYGRLLLKLVGTGALGALCTLAAFLAIGRLDRLVGLTEAVEEFDGLG